LANNKVSLPLITEAQIFRALDVQQKYMSHIPVMLALCLQTWQPKERSG